MKDQHSESTVNLKYYLKIASSFASTKLGLLLIRHPIHVVQTQKQADSSLKNWQIIKTVYNQNGLKGFYRATPLSIFKILLAESYRGPLMIEVPKRIKTILSNTVYLPNNSLSCSLIATPIISSIDSLLLCPILRLYTHQLTINTVRTTAVGIAKTYLNNNLIKHCYRGFIPLLLQTTNSWGTFFILDEFTNSLAKKQSKNYHLQLILTTIGGGLLQTGINIIPDNIRVQMQKADHSKKNSIGVLKELSKTKGTSALFSGWQHKVVGNVVGFAYKSLLRRYWNDRDTKGKLPNNNPSCHFQFNQNRKENSDKNNEERDIHKQAFQKRGRPPY